jgi:hypothetical protein
MDFRGLTIRTTEEPPMSEQSSRDGNLTDVGVLIAVVLAIGIGKWLFFSNTVTSYWLYTKSGAPAAREVYSVDRSSLTVTVLDRWSNGTLWISGPERDCVIIDSENWRCGQAETLALDGHVKEQILSTDPRLREVSWFRWWIARLTHWSEAPEDRGGAH